MVSIWKKRKEPNTADPKLHSNPNDREHMKTQVITLLASISLLYSCSPRYSQRDLKDIEVARFIIPYAAQHDFEVISYTSTEVLNVSYPGFVLKSHKKLELQDARQLVKHLYTDMMDSIQKSVEAQTNDEALRSDVHMRPVNLSSEGVSFRIDFCDTANNRSPKPYISQITLRRGTVCFYEMDDKTKKLVLVTSESIKDLSK